MSTLSQYQHDVNFFQRRLQALQTDIEDITLMYLQAQSTKNIGLAEQCEITLRSARQHQYEVTQALKAYQRPVARKSI
jgi:predicted kinase